MVKLWGYYENKAHKTWTWCGNWEKEKSQEWFQVFLSEWLVKKKSLLLKIVKTAKEKDWWKKIKNLVLDLWHRRSYLVS